jgi:hypothetical protein
MSTPNEPPANRPRPDDVRPTTSGLIQRLRENATSIRQSLTLAGIAAVVLGGIIWVFIRDLSDASLIVVYAGFILLLIAGGMSWRTVRKVVFGRGGKYGFNSVSILIVAFGIAGIVNYVFFWADGRPNPPGFLRVDTTFTKQFLLEEKVQNTLDNLKEPVRITAFFPTDTREERAAWLETEDTLSEFKRRSTTHSLEYLRVDPELDPSEATRYGVTVYPSLVVEAIESQRREIIRPAVTNDLNPLVHFSEQDIVTGLLVVNQIQQKLVMFISGHSERDILSDEDFDAYGLAWNNLDRENYALFSGTLQELGSQITSGNRANLPAVVVFANPRQDMSLVESQIIREYARTGGSILMLLEPDTTPDTFLTFLARYGVAVGVGEVVDTASFIPPNPMFLQIKRSNQQLPPHEITADFDVLYLPGSTYLGTSVDPNSIPVTDSGVLYVQQQALAISTLSSWAETSLDGRIAFDPASADRAGPLPLAITIEAIAELLGSPTVEQGEFVETRIVAIGDADFASNQAFSSAKNGDLFVNSVNWLAKDFELISIRSKLSTFRRFDLTTPERDFVRWSGWLLMPSLIGLAGVWVWWRRR